MMFPVQVFDNAKGFDITSEIESFSIELNVNFTARFLLSLMFSLVFKKYHPANISTLFQRCLLVDATSRRGATSTQC